ncbi:hypothetical protein SSYRP_v1c06930 [Spiroplasma syrphidicola EA-1]|uniref:Chitinase n=1 Tax=Spiroplasma syrphidicola EA-1 TaxID=1276229 RepID=R4U6N7_9MOLU|nr:hypothetical protein [Spiroplasma syrphidicola]AGM26283.1 hypothetical protein SSYRP_v1c06930 [Spiroplasma syrphidicola EA-1]
MKSLLVILSLMNTPAAGVAPVVTSTENVLHINDDAKEMIEVKHSLDLKGFVDPNNPGTLVEGELDFTESLVDFIETTKNQLAELNATSFEVTAGESHFNNTAIPGHAINLGPILDEILHAKTYEVLSLTATVTGPSEYDNYQFGLSAQIVLDGVEKTMEMDSFLKSQELAWFQIAGGFYNLYNIEFSVGQSIEHTDDNFISNIALPDLGFDYVGFQVRDLFRNNEEFIKLVISTINSQLKTNIKTINVEKVSKVDGTNPGVVGAEYGEFEVINEELVYVSFSSADATGIYHMLIQA